MGKFSKFGRGKAGREDREREEFLDGVVEDAALDEADEHLDAADEAQVPDDEPEGSASLKRTLMSWRGKGKGKKGTRTEERLMSVIDESEPGATLDLLNKNSKFVVEDERAGNAYVVLVLPTADPDFGGLSQRQSKNQDKGAFINLLVHDDIHSLVTQELLEDDALGLIPDQESLEAMDEFLLLTEARYVFGVVVENYETGGLVVFSVPPKDPASADGHIFADAMAVSKGTKKLEDVVSIGLIEAMIDIYLQGPVAEGEAVYGLDGLNRAMAMNIDEVATSLRAGHYPEGEDLVQNLADAFPIIAEGLDEAYEEELADGELDEPETEALGSIDEAELSDDEPDFGAGDAPTVAMPAAGGGDEPEFGDDGATGAGASPAAAVEDDEAAADEPGSDYPDEGTAVDDEAADAEDGRLVTGSTGTLDADALRALLDERLEEFAGRLGQPAVGTPAAVLPGVTDDRDFNYKDVAATAARTYVNDSLGLYIDGQLFDQSLTVMPYEIARPEAMAATPWLKDQFDVLVSNLNGQLLAQRQENYQELRLQYLGLVDKAIAEISAELDYEAQDSEFAVARSAIEADRDEMAGDLPRLKQEAEAQVRAKWDSIREEFLAGARLRAEQEFESKHGPRRSLEFAAVERDLKNTIEETIASKYSVLNEKRRMVASSRLDEVVSMIIESLRPRLESQQSQERKAYEQALASVNSFVADYREEDMRQANVTEARLAADTRVEQLSSENAARIESIRADHAQEMLDMQARLEQQAADFRRTLSEQGHSAQVTTTAAQTRVMEIQSMLDASRDEHALELGRVEARAAEAIKSAEASAAQARADVDTYVKAQKTDNTVLWMVFVLLSIMALVAGIMLGVFVF